MAIRRRTLLGLGGLLVGGGALVSTGAFSSVDAQRSVALETADDSDAFLAFEVLDNDHVSETDGTIEFDLITEARTRFEGLIDVRNQGTQTVQSLRFEFDVTGATQSDSTVEDALKITSGSATIPATDDTNLLLESDEGGAGDDDLAPGEAVPFGIEVDLTDTPIDSIDGDPEITLTIIADTEGGTSNGATPTPGGSPSFAYSAGPTREPSNDVAFTIENVGSGSATIEAFNVTVTGPGNPPTEFEAYEIDPESGSAIDDDAGYDTGTDVAHASYAIDAGETAAYVIETFDRNPSANGELTLELVAADGSRFALDATGFQ